MMESEEKKAIKLGRWLSRQNAGMQAQTVEFGFPELTSSQEW